MGRKLVAVAILLFAALSLSAAYVTAVAGNDIYIIDEQTGRVINHIKDGEVVDSSSVHVDYPMITFSESISKYALNFNVRAKFSDDNIYLHFDICTEEGANNDVLEELMDEGTMITIRFFDKDRFLLRTEELNLSVADQIRNADNDIVRLTDDWITNGSEVLLDLVDHMDLIYDMGWDVTPADTFFMTILSTPKWIQHSYYVEDGSVFHFYPTDILVEYVEDDKRSSLWYSEIITEEKRDYYEYYGIEPDVYFHDESYGDVYKLIFDDYFIERSISFYPTESPYIIEVGYDNEEERYPLLRTDYRATIEIPDWLIGSWSYGESGMVEVSETDIVIDGTSVVDDATEATVETYLAIGIVDPYLETEIGEDSFTIYIDEMPTTVSKTNDPLVIEVSGFMVPDNEVLTLTKNN